MTTCEFNQRNMLELMIASDDLGFPMSEVRVVSAKFEAAQQITDEAFDLTTTKYPEWPYRSNKRADKFFERQYTKLQNQLRPITLQVTKHTPTFYTACVRSSDACNDEIINSFVDYGNPDSGVLSLALATAHDLDVDLTSE